MITAANFETYVKENGPSAALFYFVHMVDSAGNNYYYSDYHTQLDSYIPTNLSISKVVYRVNLRDGIYSVAPVKVRIDNTQKPQADSSVARFSANFSLGEFETELCTIYLGYDGCASADFLPFYKGRMTNFISDTMNIEFQVEDRALFELPLIPANTFNLSTHSKLSDSLIGKPIPIVYGKFDYEAENTNGDTTQWGVKSVIPAYIVEHDLDITDPEIVVECADHALDAINDVYIFDDNLVCLGAIQDTITNDLANARATIDLRTSSDQVFITATHYLYPDRAEANLTSGSVGDCLDMDSTTSAPITSSDDVTFFFPVDISQLPRSEMEPTDPNGSTTECVGISSVEIEVAGYADSSFGALESLLVEVVNGQSTVSVSGGSVPTFNGVGWHNFTTDLVLCRARIYDDNLSTDTMIRIGEADDSGGTNEISEPIIPANGTYPTMEACAREIELKIASKTENGDLANSYTVTYDPSSNKFIVNRIAGSQWFRIQDAVGNQAEDFGFTVASPSWQETEFTSDDVTMLDVPDGDFSYLKLKLTSSGTPTYNLKGLRLKVQRTYRAFNVITPRRVFQTGPFRQNSAFSGLEVPIFSRTPPRYTAQDQNNARSVLDTVSSSNFYVEGIGQPDASTSYYTLAPDIIKSILEDQIGIASGDIDSTAFSTASTNASTKNFITHIADQKNPTGIFAELCRLMGGFFHISQEGKYTITALKSSYTSTTADYTIAYRDIASLSDDFKIGRIPINQVSKNLDLFYTYDLSKGEHHDTKTKTTNSTLNIQKQSITTKFVNNNATAGEIAEFYSGDGDTYGFFGKMRAFLSVKLMAGEYHRVELGDKGQLDSAWDSKIDIYGTTASSVKWMTVGKRYDKREIVLDLIQLNIIGDELYVDNSNGSLTVHFDFKAIAEASPSNNDWYPTTAPASWLVDDDDSANDTEWELDGTDYVWTTSGTTGIYNASAASPSTQPMMRYNNTNQKAVINDAWPGSDVAIYEVVMNAPTNPTSEAGVFLSAPVQTGQQREFYFGLNSSGEFYGFADYGSGGTSSTAQETGSDYDGTSGHYAMAIYPDDGSGTVGKIYLFVNGQEVASAAWAETSLPAAATDQRIVFGKENTSAAARCMLGTYRAGTLYRIPVANLPTNWKNDIILNNYLYYLKEHL